MSDMHPSYDPYLDDLHEANAELRETKAKLAAAEKAVADWGWLWNERNAIACLARGFEAECDRLSKGIADILRMIVVEGLGVREIDRALRRLAAGQKDGAS